MSLTVSGYAMVPFDSLCRLLDEPVRAAVLIGDAVRRVSTSATISATDPPEHLSATSARMTVRWHDGADVAHSVYIALHAVQGGTDPITEITVKLHDSLEPSRRVSVARGLHRILDLLASEVEHPAAHVDLTVSPPAAPTHATPSRSA